MATSTSAAICQSLLCDTVAPDTKRRRKQHYASGAQVSYAARTLLFGTLPNGYWHSLNPGSEVLLERLPFNSTCPLDNQDTLRADCPGARFTVNVFPSTHRGRAQRAPPCKNKASPLQIPAFSVFSRNGVLRTLCKVCAFTRALFLRRREPTSLEQTIFFDASPDWGGRGHKNLLV